LTASASRMRSAATRCSVRRRWPNSAKYWPPIWRFCSGKSLPGCANCARVRPTCPLPPTDRRYSTRQAAVCPPPPPLQLEMNQV
jgi:hypothetical protein